MSHYAYFPNCFVCGNDSSTPPRFTYFLNNGTSIQKKSLVWKINLQLLDFGGDFQANEKATAKLGQQSLRH